MLPRSLLRVLALVFGFFYFDTVCQTDAKDARAYYAHCITEYVAAPAASLVVLPTRPRQARQRLRYRAALAHRLARQPSCLVARCLRACPRSGTVGPG